MFRLFKKKTPAKKKWHSKAMLIDPHKTRLIITNIETIERTASMQIDSFRRFPN